MNIQAEKLELMKLLLETNDQTLLKTIKALFNKVNNSDFWNMLTDAEKKEILIAEEQIKTNEVSDYETFIKSHR